MFTKKFILLTIVANICFEFGLSYSAIEDARVIKEYKLWLKQSATNFGPELNHAKIARQIVHKSNWASVGTVSVDSAIKDYPMVNIISVNDNDESGNSTGKIQFLLTNLDFTGLDWQRNNRVSMLFSEDQDLECSKHGKDPMEPTCKRTIISGQIVKVDENDKQYKGAINAFVNRHPASKNWLHAHVFYLCELLIKHIYVLDYYGGPHSVTAADYYNQKV